MKQINLGEFVFRLKDLLNNNEDSKIVFFIGAGCSVSSGIPAAGELVNLWLPRLKKMKTGDENSYEEWACVNFKDFKLSDASKYYGRVIEELFITSQERQKEIERLTENKDPGFGYAVLATIMSHEKFGKQCNIVLTVNFDDLVADALYLYTQKKPLVITHESLIGFMRITGSKPLVVKLHGDARLEPKNTELETSHLDTGVKAAFTNILAERGLIFIGYSGNDKSILEILNNLPKNSLPWGIYWVGNDLPESNFKEWLKERNAIHVKHLDFDELMLLIMSEFDFNDPNWKRFNYLQSSYQNKLKNLIDNIQTIPDSSERKILDKATKKIIKKSESWYTVYFEASKYTKKDFNRANTIYQEGFKKFPKSDELHYYYARFLESRKRNYSSIESSYKKAIDLNPTKGYYLNAYAHFLESNGKDIKRIDKYFENALKKKEDDVDLIYGYAFYLSEFLKNYRKADIYFKRTIELQPQRKYIYLHYALFLRHKLKKNKLAEKYFDLALKKYPNDVETLDMYALFLKDITKDYDNAKIYFEKAININPHDANSHANYGGLLLALGDIKGFTLVEKALNSNRGKNASRTIKLECLFYLYIHKKYSSNSLIRLKKIKKLLLEEIRSMDFSLQLNVERAIKDGFKFPEFIKDLSQVISDQKKIRVLDKYEEWRAI